MKKPARAARPSAPTAFATAARFRAWLERNHAREDELILLLFKVHASGRGIGYREALDEALCFGWIDGVRRGHDEDRFTVRFTPRRARSIWSAVNIRRVGELKAQGRMRLPGTAAFESRDPARAKLYSFESKAVGLPAAYTKRFRANARAWAGFNAQPPWYRRTCHFWVMSAKREETRERRLDRLIATCARGEGLPPLKWKETDTLPSRGRTKGGGTRATAGRRAARRR